ncbi:MAG: YhbY family RNA-binding protein [Butyricicoccus sp.]|jgi:RNA-binding protein
MELTSRQRAQLRGLANTLDDMVLIGKGGLTDAVLREVDSVLAKKELVKIKILETAMLTPRTVQAVLCEELDAAPVQCIGTKTVIYREAVEPEDRKIVLITK